MNLVIAGMQVLISEVVGKYMSAAVSSATLIVSQQIKRLHAMLKTLSVLREILYHRPN